jgi:hypothetical protein
MVGFSSDADKLFANANQTASEAFNNIRTVCCPSHILPCFMIVITTVQPVLPAATASALQMLTSNCVPHDACRCTCSCKCIAPPVSGPVYVDVRFGPCQVSAFQMEDSIAHLYSRLLGPPTKASEKRAQISGVGFGVSQGIMFLTYATIKLSYALTYCMQRCSTCALLGTADLATCLIFNADIDADGMRMRHTLLQLCACVLVWWQGGHPR